MHSAIVSGDFSAQSWASAPYASDHIQKLGEHSILIVQLPFKNLAHFDSEDPCYLVVRMWSCSMR